MIAAMTETPSPSEVFAPGVLQDRTALVTGGGTGLGKATAVELARCGARVTIAGRRAEVLELAAAEIAGAAGLDEPELVSWISADIRDPEDARALIAGVLERGGGLDVLVNNAGGQFFSPAELIAAKGWRAVWRLNVEGMLNMAEAAFDMAFEGAGAGTVVNVTLSPHHGMPGMAHSGAARATVEALTRELAERWAAANVAVVKYPASVRAGMSQAAPLQRLGTVQEHAWLVALLASPVGRALNGSTITLDGARDNWFGPWPPAGMASDSGEVPVEERRAPGGAPA
jgi:citronellol/citronellal dehydrogenase